MDISRKVFHRIRGHLNEAHYQELSSTYNLRGYKRIYLAHIRKTGGTSLNNMFLSLGSDQPNTLYRALAKAPEYRLVRKGKVFVGWNERLINKGHYFYGFSHTPLHQLQLPDDTFTVTCFRDPVKRVISHYNMLRDYVVNDIPHPTLKTEGKWLGNSFDDFLERIPRRHLQNQLYMFSEHFDIDEAVERVDKLSLHFFLDNFTEGVKRLNEETGLELKPIHIRKAKYREEIPASSIEKLRNRMADEYTLLERIARL